MNNQTSQTPIPAQVSHAPIPPNKPKVKINWSEKLKPTLSTYIVSGVLLAVLLFGGIWFVWSIYDSNQMRKDVENYRALAEMQKNHKNTVTDIWEQQASLNDELVTFQNLALGEIITYQSELVKNFRFQNNEPQANPGQNVDKLRQSEERLYNLVKDMEASLDKNAAKKQELKNKVDTLYKQSEEEQNRRLNPRDGNR
jgi:hypothetical protein